MYLNELRYPTLHPLEAMYFRISIVYFIIEIIKNFSG